MSYGIIILAAGNGSRMQSDLPKVLHKLAGKPMLEHLIATALQLQNLKPTISQNISYKISPIVIVAGLNIIQLQAACNQHQEYKGIIWAHQAQQLGTANALAAGLKLLNPEVKQVLVLSGDTPLVSAATLNNLIIQTSNIGLVTTQTNNPAGYGRIVRDDHNNFLKIAEELDANNTEKQITEINTGIYLFSKDFLEKFLPKINNHNHKQEYYLTDLFKLATDHNILVNSSSAIYPWEVKGVNNRTQLIALEREFQLQQALNLLEQGVTILDPTRLDIRGNVKIASDVEIDVNVILLGNTIIEKNVKIGANCWIKDSVIGENAIIEPNSMIDGARIDQNTIIGPFARLRTGSNIGAKSKIGNFVEIKASTIGANTKINHLSYIGDAKIGSNVNIGAGTITCNYDGVNKHITTIEDYVSVGSDCQLIAPVKIGKHASIAAGTTLVKDAPENKLTLNTKTQHSREWQKPIKKEIIK